MNDSIIFMGTPQIAADVLQKLLDAKANISLVVTQPDKKAGRKQKIVFSPVKQLALEHNIPVFQPEKIKKDYQAILDANADLIVTCAYGQIVGKEVLSAATQGCVNLHGSILPEYRGAAPIQRAIWDGKKKSGMSLMRMEEGMDTGPVMDIAEIEIEEADTTTTLFEKMGACAGDLIVKNLPVLLSGQAVFEKQDDSRATYAAMISKEEEEIDFTKSDEEIFNQIRALSRTPGAYFSAQNKKIKILSATYVPEEQQQEAGWLEKEGKKQLYLSLHHGKLYINELQMEAKPAMKAADFVNGLGRSLLHTKIDAEV